ncbi:MAG: DUF4157 domain-containing protein [Spirulinaceae cyanobacterium RM2_2_10]|nr:DUF4157 domain-containing protein [Spirulinaceae cyanobacterium RM2_2_10]
MAGDGADLESMIAIIEWVRGILNIIDLILNLIAATLTLVGGIMLGIGSGLVALGTALLSNPFTAAAGPPLISAGTWLQGIGNMLIGWGSTVWGWEKPFGITILQLTLYTLLLRPFAIIFRILDLKFCSSDPEVLLQKQEALSQSTAKFLTDGASASSKLIGDKMKTSEPNKAKIGAKGGVKSKAQKSIADDYFGKKEGSTLKHLLNPKNTFGAYTSKSGGGAFDPAKKWKGLSTGKSMKNMGYDPANIKAKNASAKSVATSTKGLKTAQTNKANALAKMNAAKADYDASITNKGKSLSDVKAAHTKYMTAKSQFDAADLNYTQANLQYNGAKASFNMSSTKLGGAKNIDAATYGDLVSGGDRKALSGIGKILNKSVFATKKENQEVNGKTVKVTRLGGSISGANVSDAAEKVSSGDAEIGDRDRYFWETIDWSSLYPNYSYARAEDEAQAKENEAQQDDQGEQGNQGDEAAAMANDNAVDQGEQTSAPEGSADSDPGKLEQPFSALSDIPDFDVRTEEEAEEDPEDADVDEADEGDFEELYADPVMEETVGEADDEGGEDVEVDEDEEGMHPVLGLVFQRLAAGADELPEPPWEALQNIDAAAFGLEELAYQKESNAQLREDNEWATAAAQESAATHEAMRSAAGAAVGHIEGHKVDMDVKMDSQADLQAESATQGSEVGTVGKEGKSLQKDLDSQRPQIDKSGEYGSSQEVDDSEGDPDVAQEGMANGSEQMDAFQDGAGKSVEQAGEWIGQTQAAKAEADADQAQLEDFEDENLEQLEAAEEEIDTLEENQEEIEASDEDIAESEDALLDSHDESIAEAEAWTEEHEAAVEAIYDDVEEIILAALGEEDEADAEEAAEEEAEAEEMVAEADEDAEDVIEDDADELEDADMVEVEEDEAIADFDIAVDEAAAEDEVDFDEAEFDDEDLEPDDAEIAAELREMEGIGGESLPSEIQAKLGIWGVTDADQIVIHTGEEANAMCEGIAAHAAVPLDGEPHIFFAEGRDDFSSDDGMNLLLHEVAHLAQIGAIASGALEDGMPVEESLPLDGDPQELMEAFLQENLTADADLTDADLSGISLAGFDLSGANLSGADLTDADLRDINLSGADLTGTDLTGADLKGADLSDVEIDDETILDDEDLELVEQ